jgi:hypothetical protein
MVREGAPTMSLFAREKDVDADRSLCPGLDPGIGMTGQRNRRVEFHGDLVLPLCQKCHCRFHTAAAVRHTLDSHPHLHGRQRAQ